MSPRAYRILIVDDDPTIVQMLADILTDEGYEVATATQSLRVFDRAKEANPDLIIQDIMMPYLDGLDLIKLYSLDDNLKNVPILVITAKAHALDGIEDLRALRIVDYLYKPFEVSVLLEKIKAALANVTPKDRGLEQKVRTVVQPPAGGARGTPSPTQVAKPSRETAVPKPAAPSSRLGAASEPIGRGAEKAKLEALRQRLEEDVAKLSQADGDRTPYGGDFESLVTAAQIASQHETDEILRRRLARRLEEVERIAHRLEEGKYGVCEKCGKEIEVERLKSRPDTTYCSTCFRELSRRPTWRRDSSLTSLQDGILQALVGLGGSSPITPLRRAYFGRSELSGTDKSRFSIGLRGLEKKGLVEITRRWGTWGYGQPESVTITESGRSRTS